jgi:hypothetical protein
VLFLVILAAIIYYFRGTAEYTLKTIQKVQEEGVMGGRWDEPKGANNPEVSNSTNLASHGAKFKPGTPKPVGQPYTRTIVIPHKATEDVSWITEIFPPSGDVKSAIYTVDDPSAPLHPPKNKGHEGMVYLTYIIDNYESLPDISIFLHAHRQAWHTNELLSNDAVQLISRLSLERVIREGYMNLRCHWEPGCPAWMHPGSVEEDINKMEQTSLARAWKDLFPGDEIPKVLAQPCCAQFAISKERIQNLKKGQYIFYRDWLLSTELSDAVAGRVWEYLWGYLFTGKSVLCPKEHVCYCDGFGVCFGGEEQYDAFWKKMWGKRELEDKLKTWKTNGDKINAPDSGMSKLVEGSIADLQAQIDGELAAAKERGNNFENRAKEAG